MVVEGEGDAGCQGAWGWRFQPEPEGAAGGPRPTLAIGTDQDQAGTFTNL